MSENDMAGIETQQSNPEAFHELSNPDFNAESFVTQILISIKDKRDLRKEAETSAIQFAQKNQNIPDIEKVAQLMNKGRVVSDEMDYVIQRVNGLLVASSSDFIGNKQLLKSLMESDKAILSVVLGLQDEHKFKVKSKKQLDSLVTLINILNYSEGVGLEIHPTNQPEIYLIVNAQHSTIRSKYLQNVHLNALGLQGSRQKLAQEVYQISQSLAETSRHLQTIEKGITDIVILTHNEPETLRKALDTYTTNLIVFKHTTVRVNVYDDTPEGLRANKNRQITEEHTRALREKSITVRYVGTSEKRTFKDKLVDQMIRNGENEALARSFVDRTFKPSEGGNRNFIQADLDGKKIIMVDHDSEFKVLATRKSLLKRGPRYDNLGAMSTVEKITKSEDPEAMKKTTVEIRTNSIGVFNRLLGKKVEDLGEYGIRSVGHEKFGRHIDHLLDRDTGKITHVSTIVYSGDEDVDIPYYSADFPGVIEETFVQNNGQRVREYSPEILTAILRGQVPRVSALTTPIQNATVTRKGRSSGMHLAIDLGEISSPVISTNLRLVDFSSFLTASYANPYIRLAVAPIAGLHHRTESKDTRLSIVDELWNAFMARMVYFPLRTKIDGQWSLSFTDASSKEVNDKLRNLGVILRKELAPQIKIDIEETKNILRHLKLAVDQAKKLADMIDKNKKASAKNKKKVPILRKFVDDATQRFERNGVSGLLSNNNENAMNEYIIYAINIGSKEMKKFGNLLKGWPGLMQARNGMNDVKAGAGTRLTNYPN